MNAIRISYDDVKSFISSRKNRKFKRKVVRKMGGKDSWNSHPASFREMRDKGVDIPNLRCIFCYAEKIPLETKRLYALECAKRCLLYFSNADAIPPTVRDAIFVPNKTFDEYANAYDDLFKIWKNTKLSECQAAEVLAFEVLFNVLDQYFFNGSASYCSKCGQEAAFRVGGEKSQEEELQQQLSDIIQLTELENQVGEKLA